MKKIVTYFLQGLLYTVPIVVTLFIIIKAVLWVDDLIPFEIPGLGLIVILIAITIIGYLGSNLLFRPVFLKIEKIMENAPLIKTIYTSIKDLLSAFVGKKRSFSHPVWVKLSDNNQYEQIGFVSQQDMKKLGNDEDKIAVYVPFSYMIGGNLYILPKKNIRPLDANSMEVMKFIISGGISKYKIK